MTIKLAYQVSYITEYQDGRVEAHDKHTRFFATREQAVAHAQQLTGATEDNGIFRGEWTNPFIAMIDPDYQDEWRNEIRVTATVETVTLDEIEASL